MQTAQATFYMHNQTGSGWPINQAPYLDHNYVTGSTTHNQDLLTGV